MLNSELCKKCKFPIMPSDNNFEKNWDNDWVFCNNGVNSFCLGRSAKEIPYWCEYKLEHLVTTQDVEQESM